MLSSFVGAFFYLMVAFFLIPKFQLVGAAISFCFILVPYPVYIYILNNLLNVKLKWYLTLTMKALLIIIAIIILSFIIYKLSYLKLLIFYGTLLFTLSILLVYTFGFITRADLKNLKSRVARI